MSGLRKWQAVAGRARRANRRIRRPDHHWPKLATRRTGALMGAASWPRVAVVGAGAVGGYFGGVLARAGAPVMLIGRRSHVDVWAREGLFLDSAEFQGRIAVAASTDAAAAGDAELVLFSVKSPDTERTARELAGHLRGDPLIVSLQNGVDNVL